MTALLLVLAAQVSAADAPKIYAMTPKVVGLPSAVATSSLEAIAQAASEEGVTVTSQADAQAILARQIELNQLGADDNGIALASLGQAVGAKHLLAATLTAEGEDVVIFMRLIASEGGAVLARRDMRASELGGDLTKALQAVTKLTLAPLFAHLKGKLSLEVSEEEANVLVDGSQLGVTPMSPFELPGGFHLLTVDKEGFIRHQETLRIAGEDIIQKIIRLRPSAEFMRAYRDRNGTYRILAWVSSVLAVGGLGTMGALFGLKGAQDAETKKIDADQDALKVSDPVAAFNNNQTYLDARQGSLNEATRLGQGAVGAAVGGGVMALIAVYFWVFGEDPDRYIEFENAP